MVVFFLPLQMFIRFITHELDQTTGLEKGLLMVAYELLEQSEVTEYESALIREHLAWLKKRLPIPDIFTRTRNASHKNTHGLSWLKPGATEALNHLRVITAILEEHGIAVSMLKDENPGYVVYEDEWQIVAEPFSKN